MTPGQIARKLLGPKLFPLAGRAYRSIFVDLDRVVESFPPIPAGAHVLEVGGGDGELMNALLTKNPAARATMIDIGTRIGASLREEFRPRVELLPGTSLRDYKALGRPAPDIVLICDVMHHIPPAQRRAFLLDVKALVDGHPTLIVVKDIRPGLLRSRLSYLADRYISGDANVSLLDETELESLMRETMPGASAQRTQLFDRDPPNYAVTFKLAPS